MRMDIKVNKNELQKDSNYDNKKGTPDIAFIDEPLVIDVDGTEMKIYCFWITTKMRYKFWQQQDKYSKVHGMVMFVLRLDYVEYIQVGDNAVVVSLKWFKILSIGCDEEKIAEIKENDEWIYYDVEQEDERNVDEDYAALYPTKESVY